MIDLGLDHDEYEAYLAALRESHEMRATITIRNRHEERIERLDDEGARLISGAVQVDRSSPVTRSLDLTFLDPEHGLQFDRQSPGRGAVYADRFIGVTYDVWVEALARWIEVPVFWGPLTAFSRTGSEVTIEAQGKESLLLAPAYSVESYTLRRGLPVARAIRRVANRSGEKRFRLPAAGRTLSKPRAVTATSQPWLVITGGEEDSDGRTVEGLVESFEKSHDVFYDGRGRLTVRRAKTDPGFTFTDGHLVSAPSFTYDVTEFRNAIDMRGVNPEGKKAAAHARVVLPRAHPLSPRSLARNGQPRYLIDWEEAPNAKTEKDCRERAQTLLEKRSREGLDASFDCLPVPHLEEVDIVRLSTDDYTVSFPLTTFTIPLVSGDSMAIGYNRRVKLGRTRPKRTRFKSRRRDSGKKARK